MAPERVVLDASAAVELVVGGARVDEVDRHLRRSVIAAPAHLDAEVLSALARLHRAGVLDDDAVDEALDDLAAAPITRYPTAPLLHPAWRLRGTVAVRDALYVCVARALDATLLTVDGRLARACAAGQLCRVALAA